MIRKTLTPENIVSLFRYLQPTTPSNSEYPAEWWNDEYGKNIITKQKNYIARLKTNLIHCKRKKQIQLLFNFLQEDDNCFIGWVEKEKKNKKLNRFWSSGFGAVILTQWGVMISTFVNHLNELEDVN